MKLSFNKLIVSVGLATALLADSVAGEKNGFRGVEGDKDVTAAEHRLLQSLRGALSGSAPRANASNFKVSSATHRVLAQPVSTTPCCVGNVPDTVDTSATGLGAFQDAQPETGGWNVITKVYNMYNAGQPDPIAGNFFVVGQAKIQFDPVAKIMCVYAEILPNLQSSGYYFVDAFWIKDQSRGNPADIPWLGSASTPNKPAFARVNGKTVAFEGCVQDTTNLLTFATPCTEIQLHANWYDPDEMKSDNTASTGRPKDFEVHLDLGVEECTTATACVREGCGATCVNECYCMFSDCPTCTTNEQCATSRPPGDCDEDYCTPNGDCAVRPKNPAPPGCGTTTGCQSDGDCTASDTTCFDGSCNIASGACSDVAKNPPPLGCSSGCIANGQCSVTSSCFRSVCDTDTGVCGAETRILPIVDDLCQPNCVNDSDCEGSTVCAPKKCVPSGTDNINVCSTVYATSGIDCDPMGYVQEDTCDKGSECNGSGECVHGYSIPTTSCSWTVGYEPQVGGFGACYKGECQGTETVGETECVKVPDVGKACNRDADGDPLYGVCDGGSVCTNENGIAQCPPVYKEGAVCEAATRCCEANALCPSGSYDCPVTQPVSAGTQCRPACEACGLTLDPIEYCNGVDMTCPPNVILEDELCIKAGQHNDAGSATVTAKPKIDGTGFEICIDFTIGNGWYLDGTVHVDIRFDGTSPANSPGSYEYHYPASEAITTMDGSTFNVCKDLPADPCGEGTDISASIALHIEVNGPSSETAWMLPCSGDGLPGFPFIKFNKKGMASIQGWGQYITWTACCPTSCGLSCPGCKDGVGDSCPGPTCLVTEPDDLNCCPGPKDGCEDVCVGHTCPDPPEGCSCSCVGGVATVGTDDTCGGGERRRLGFL